MKHYYEAVVLVEVEDDGWDCGCDETFAVLRALKASWPTKYKKITKKYFDKNKHKIIQEEGGI